MKKIIRSKILMSLLCQALICGMIFCLLSCNKEAACLHESTITENTATCTESGVEKLVCNNCKTVISEKTAEKLGHDYSKEVILAGKCKRCNNVVSNSQIFYGMQSVLLMGQSNMAGRGDLNAVEAINDERIFMQRNGTWVKMTEPIHYDKTIAGVGLAASFAEAFVNTFDVELGLVPCAFGGTSMSDWKVGGQLYNDTVTRAKAAMKDSEICAILWHQGCSEQSNSDGYAEKFQAMIDALLAELGLDADKIVIITGELGTFRTNDTTAFHNELNQIGNYYKHYAVTSSYGLTAQDVTTHFDAPSLRVFGYRYFSNFYKCMTGSAFTDYSEYPNDYAKNR